MIVNVWGSPFLETFSLIVWDTNHVGLKRQTDGRTDGWTGGLAKLPFPSSLSAVVTKMAHLFLGEEHYLPSCFSISFYKLYNLLQPKPTLSSVLWREGLEGFLQHRKCGDLLMAKVNILPRLTACSEQQWVAGHNLFTSVANVIYISRETERSISSLIHFLLMCSMKHGSHQHSRSSSSETCF